jgi:hypothetical protein
MKEGLGMLRLGTSVSQTTAGRRWRGLAVALALSLLLAMIGLGPVHATAASAAESACGTTPATSTTTACSTQATATDSLSALSPQPVAYYLIILFSGHCSLGTTNCSWSWDWQANCMLNPAPLGCYMHGTGTLQLTAEDCLGATFKGTMTYYASGLAPQTFSVLGATFGNQFVINGSGSQFLAGMVDIVELCTGTNFISLGGYGYGTVN